jgi:hypothetical protein
LPAACIGEPLRRVALSTPRAHRPGRRACRRGPPSSSDPSEPCPEPARRQRRRCVAANHGEVAS